MNKFVGVTILALGEIITIAAEIFAAKYFGIELNGFKGVFWKLIIPMTVGGCLLLGGYMLSMATFKNIWIVTVISIGSILIAEPILNYSITGQLPTRGALIGFIFGVLGLIATFVL